MRRLWLLSVGSAAVAGILAGVLLHGTGRAASLRVPELFGQATWAPGLRPAPRAVPRGRTVALVTGGRRALAFLRAAMSQVTPAARPRVLMGAKRGRAAIVLVDRNGFERAGIVLPFAPGFIARDLKVLAS